MNSKRASELMGISIDTIRYYERVGVIPPIGRDENGYRNFRTNDLNWVFLAKNFKKAGMSVESMIEFATLAQSKHDVSNAQKDLLKEQLEEIDKKFDELNRTRDILKYKIETYDDHVAKFKAGDMDADNTEKLWESDKFISNDEK
ncbi:MerR family transcriptional regulator [Secundilactobacillus malefermentans]|uniref:HTH merR-type domain-containing protein n=1 Tax=Secundilactobacillus malefermentans TaxID=176292 RepID=A0A4V3A3A9_9LACO|nr:MerR family transcriptional regulator [Secundilactobacillus malefermentans]KRM59106.1 MerR family transcriptional regulator [Secundilactobacillus malefermentans DSM 5705 = KCTC 3548]QEA31418.1 MerR family transcriptional regulator [Secundilactobacillus malefermentans]TDG73918.1 hypothetical protein C5L31_002069 [Secundilactobacillus malefermentans]